MNTISTKAANVKVKGFILPFTMLITTLILFVVGSSMVLISKQMYFSKIYKQTQLAYYAADDGLSCAIAIDDTYVAADGLGIFPSLDPIANPTSDPLVYINDVFTYNNIKRGVEGLSPITALSDIKCAQSYVFDANSQTSNFQVSPTPYTYVSKTAGTEKGRTSTFTLRMNVGGGQYRCAKITVNKTQSFRQVISQGYPSCDMSNGAVERAIVNTTTTE